MAGQTGQSSVMGQLGKALAGELQKEASFGNPTMPGGVEGGIAQLRECKIDVFKEGTKHQGKEYFLAYGIAVSPAEHKGMPVAGLRTQIGSEPLCDTPENTWENARRTEADHWGWVINELRILGLEDYLKSLAGKSDAEIKVGIKVGMAALCKPPEKGQPDNRPFFRFRTSTLPSEKIEQSAGKWVVKRGSKVLGSYGSEQAAKAKHPYAGREDRIYHEWNGICDYKQEAGLPTNPTQVQDDSGSLLPQPSANGAGNGGGQIQAPTSAGDADADGGVAELVTQANAGSDTAKKQLDAMARAAGATPEQVDAAENWEAVAALITGVASEPVVENPSTTPAEEEASQGTPTPVETDSGGHLIDGDELPPPAVDEPFMYQQTKADGTPMKARNGKVIPPVKCSVKTVDEEKQTVDLVAADGKKTFFGVAWDALLPVE